MSVDLKLVRNSLISVAEDSIGDLLSTIPGQGGTTLPAILKSRKKFLEQTPPFVILDQGPRRKLGLGQIRESLLDDDFTEFEVHYTYMFSYTVVGGDAAEIAGKLESSFLFGNTVIDRLVGDGIYLVDTEEVIPSSDLYNGEFVEVATFNIFVTIPETNSQDIGFFDSATISGEIWEDEEDPEPMVFSINVNNN